MCKLCFLLACNTVEKNYSTHTKFSLPFLIAKSVVIKYIVREYRYRKYFEYRNLFLLRWTTSTIPAFLPVDSPALVSGR